MNTHLKQSLASFEYPIGNWISIGHPSVSEVSAALGFDFVLVDTEHTSMGLETVENHVRAVDSVDGVTQTVVRVPDDDPARIKRVLDMGVAGVMVPMVESAAAASDLVSSVLYPPDGFRGIAGGRAANYGLDFPDYVTDANGSLVTIVQIETERGLENVEEIANVDGIDALFVGPADLSGALGVFAEWESEQLNDAMEAVIDTGAKTDTPVGTLTLHKDDIEPRIEQGFDFLIVGKDTNYVAAGSRAAKDAYVAAVERHNTSSSVSDSS